jgi:hypothetical protein
MADWQQILQREISVVLNELLDEGYAVPLYVTFIGTNGSMGCGR